MARGVNSSDPPTRVRMRSISTVYASSWAQADLKKVLATTGANVLDEELAIGTADDAFRDDETLADPELGARLQQIVHNLMHHAVRRGLLVGPLATHGRGQPAP